MKKLLVVATLFVGMQGFSKEVPAPSVLFSISEKILAQAQELFSSFDKPTVKPLRKTVIKVKSKAPLKIVEPIQEKPVAPATSTSVKVKRDGMFITTE
ncbi:hypothetical protein [Flavobacterium sp.]|uniref:hypothetical protein n=1 Tax=Flavobacterium sp. TaxID=239 RepID=UPI00120F3FE4|nr:hypothetical protein [Flavobacterium sp.]RZJ70323.1 MAG: hypothetical protein EOO49_14425 [Flavobacterium sp.]